VDEILGKMLEEVGVREGGRGGAGGGAVKVPVKQLQEIFPERSRGSRSSALLQVLNVSVCVHVCVSPF